MFLISEKQVIFSDENDRFEGLSKGCVYEVNGKSLISTERNMKKCHGGPAVQRQVCLAKFDYGRQGPEVVEFTGKKVNLLISEPVDIEAITAKCKDVMGDVILVDKECCPISGENCNSKLLSLIHIIHYV